MKSKAQPSHASTNQGSISSTTKQASSSSSSSLASPTSTEDHLASLLKNNLTIADRGDRDIVVPKSVRTVADWINGISTDAKPRILVLTGAGVSVAAGIPDFRTPGTGLYDNLQAYNLPYPEAVFDVAFYRSNPKPFCTLAKELWPGTKHSPTLTHCFLALLDKKGLLLRNYSQNIDGLEFLAGMAEDRLLECHGHFRTASCIDCGKPSNGDAVQQTIVEEGKVPVCQHCSGRVKPDIVFFGESLPSRFYTLIERDIPATDLLLVMGTSLQVAPVSMIPDMVSCRRVLFNRDPVMRIKDKKKDVFVQGDCDSNILLLCKALGWEAELLEQYERTRLQSFDAVGTEPKTEQHDRKLIKQQPQQRRRRGKRDKS